MPICKLKKICHENRCIYYKKNKTKHIDNNRLLYLTKNI